MKAERRHELKHNQLAVFVLGGFWYFSGESHAKARAWSQYFEAFNEREPQKVLQNLATEQSGSKAAWWALEAVGDMNLGEGAALLYSDRKEATKRLVAAKDAYL